MKRKLALFLVLAMIISLIPANVFAASANSVSSTPTVTEDWDFSVEGGAPTLKIEENDAGDFATSQTFLLKLSNADWGDESDIADFEANDVLSSGNIEVSYDMVGDSLEVTVGTIGTDEEYVKIPLLAEVGDAGVAKVIVDDLDSTITSGEYTFAKVAGGDTKVTYDVDNVDAFSDTDELDEITIEELAIGTVTGGQVTLRLTNNDFEWADYATEATIEAAVDMGGGLSGATLEYDSVASDAQNLVFDITVPAGVDSRGRIVFDGLEIAADSDASYGDVKVKVFGDDFTTETVTVAKYSDYAVTVESDEEGDDLNEVYAGYMVTSQAAVKGEIENDAVADVTEDDDDNELSVLWIKEDVYNTLDQGKRIKVTFPDAVSIMDVQLDDETDGVEEARFAALIDGADDDELGNEFEFTFSRTGETAGTKAEIGLKFFVSVDPSFTGDITAKVSGQAMNGETKSAVIGKAVAPITATVVPTDVKIGLKDQTVGKITVTEAEEGVLADGKSLVFKMSDMSLDGDVEVKVTKGDIEFDDAEFTADDYLILTVDNESSEASTFEITGLTVDVDRTVAEGNYNLKIGGDAIVMNNDGEGDFYFFDATNMVSVTGVRVITPAPGDVQAGEKVVFTIGSADYMVGAVKMTADAAPYINEQGRTMLPLRALANALNVSDANIMWNEVERSVTIFKGDATIKVVIGQMSFVKNGVAIPMDTQAVIVNGRTMLPLRALGQALGAVVTWDEATRTVTVQ